MFKCSSYFLWKFIRDEGKISRKLVECINIYLGKDGPNLDRKTMEIHSAVQEFVFRCWLTTHDRALKVGPNIERYSYISLCVRKALFTNIFYFQDALILYATLQLKLIRTAADGGHLIEQLLDIVCKELDQSSIASSTVLW